MSERKKKPAPGLLDLAIEEHSIPPWPYEPSFDRIVIFSVPEEKAKRKTFVPGGLVEMIETRQDFEQQETPRGILCAAGLGARDVLRSHGIDLGHMLWVARLSPWRHEVERTKEGKIISFLFMRVGDVVGSETLQAAIKAGRAHVATKPDGTHSYKFDDESARPRFDPPSYVA